MYVRKGTAQNKHITVFRCLSSFEIKTHISLKWSVWADLSCKTFENDRFSTFRTKSDMPNIPKRSKFSCRGHQNGVKFGCPGRWNVVKFGCRGHLNGVKFQSWKKVNKIFRNFFKLNFLLKTFFDQSQCQLDLWSKYWKLWYPSFKYKIFFVTLDIICEIVYLIKCFV